MAKNILEFTQAGNLGENDFFHIVQNGLDKKATFKQLPLATEVSDGLLSAYLCHILNRLHVSFSNGQGAGISGYKGVSLILAYQKSNMENFCVYMTVKKVGLPPAVYALSNHVLVTGANNDGGTVVILGADSEDVAQVAICVIADNVD